MTQPSISVVMAVRNGARFLDRAIASVLNQSLQPDEIVLVDGHSTDSTAAIAKSHAIIRYVMQAGRGIADAYNQGIQAAQGSLLTFLSHDDEWTPHKLAIQAQFLCDHPDLQCAVARTRFILEPGESAPPGFRSELLSGDHPAFIMETLMARRSAFEQAGRFDPAFTSGEDVDWFARAKDRGVGIGPVPEVLLIKRIHSANLSLTNPDNNQAILLALRRSVLRKRQQMS